MARERITKTTCLSCGACCVATANAKGFCEVTQADEERLGKKFVRLHVLRFRPIDMLAAALQGQPFPSGAIRTKVAVQKSGPHVNYEMITCAMLDGSVMEQVRCRIYKDRPKVCHEAVVPGDRACRTLRRIFKKDVPKSTRRKKRTSKLA